MRRSHTGQYGEYSPYQNGRTDALEDENERMTSELKDKIHTLKSLSIDIGTEVKYQERLLKEMDDDFDKSRGILGNTMNRVLKLAKGGHNYYLLYLFLFCILVFIILWIVIRTR